MFEPGDSPSASKAMAVTANSGNSHKRVSLKTPELYINRELSLLNFHRRVLEQAKDDSIPLLERLRFLCISCSNLDEFFEVRVGGIKQQLAFGTQFSAADKMTPTEVFNAVHELATDIVRDQYHVLNEVLIPALRAEKINVLRRTEWNRNRSAWIKAYFQEQVLPVITPIGLDPAHPFPKIVNKGLHFIVSLKGKDAFGRDSGFAILQAPRSLPRLIELPTLQEGADEFVFLSSVIHENIEQLFPGMTALGCYQFRVTRDSDLFVDEDEVDDLLLALKGELTEGRRFGDSVRLEVADNCPDDIADFLLNELELTSKELYRVDGPVNVSRLESLIENVNRPDLKYQPFSPGYPSSITGKNVFDLIKAEDTLLHLPFQSFNPIIDLLKQAAHDPEVLAIKQTLYRTGNDSAIVDLLCQAARNNKEVAVVIELRARFDEEANIQLATRLQDAGAHVVYGVVGYKTHAKLLMVVRREEGKLRRYCHLGTGNYHSRTAKIYTDIGLLTSDEEIGNDVHKLFLQLTGLGKAKKMKALLQAPFTLHRAMILKIQREAQHAKNGKPAHIIAKMNSLVESETIEALYKASQAGVKIELIIRGICCLRPGIPGVSENITVRSVVGQFLEHTRIVYFENDGDSEVWLGSADWMDRNFHRRIEVCFPLKDDNLKQEIIHFGLQIYLNDNKRAWELNSDGTYTHLQPDSAKPLIAHNVLLERYAVQDS